MQSESIDLLKDKVFISTRPSGKSDELRQLLQHQGAKLIEMPMIEIQPTEISSHEKQMLLAIKDYQWIVFTSANGISHFFRNVKKLTGNINIGSAKIAVIGKRTANELEGYGYTAAYINPGKTSDDFGMGLLGIFGHSYPSVLLPVGNLAGNTIEECLMSKANIHRINVYKTIVPENIESEAIKRIIGDTYEMIIFTSPSGFINFCQLVKEKLNINALRAACIGTTTAEAMEEKGIRPMLIANTMSSAGIVKKIVDYYK